MQNIVEKIKSFFESIPEILSADLFGSFAEGRENDKSDVDIAVLCRPIPSALTLISWREELSVLLNKEVDLICLNTASPIIAMQVLKNGKNILVKNEREYVNYQIKTYVNYAELKELRAPMEQEILKRKYYD